MQCKNVSRFPAVSRQNMIVAPATLVLLFIAIQQKSYLHSTMFALKVTKSKDRFCFEPVSEFSYICEIDQLHCVISKSNITWCTVISREIRSCGEGMNPNNTFPHKLRTCKWIFDQPWMFLHFCLTTSLPKILQPRILIFNLDREKSLFE